MNTMEFAIPCVYGIGVCAAHGGQGFSDASQQCITLLSQILGIKLKIRLDFFYFGVVEQRVDVFPVLDNMTEEEIARLRCN